MNAEWVPTKRLMNAWRGMSQNRVTHLVGTSPTKTWVVHFFQPPQKQRLCALKLVTLRLRTILETFSPVLITFGGNTITSWLHFKYFCAQALGTLLLAQALATSTWHTRHMLLAHPDSWPDTSLSKNGVSVCVSSCGEQDHAIPNFNKACVCQFT